MSFGPGLEPAILYFGHVAGAVLAAAAGLWSAQFGDRQRPDRGQGASGRAGGCVGANGNTCRRVITLGRGA